MAYKVYKLFLKLASSFKLILISIVFISILSLCSETAFSKVTNFEKNLAYKYCDSLEKNLFKGLDSESILKYEYFFNSINAENINEVIESLTDLPSEVETICSYKLSIEEKEDMYKLMKKFYLSNKK